MTLREAVLKIRWLSETAIIFAERVNGTFAPESNVTVLEVSDEDLGMPVSELAQERAPGKEYFLEVNLLAELLDGLREQRNGALPELDKVVQFVTYYAENDAYPPDT